MMIKTIGYKGKYIPDSIVEQCFIENKVTAVDKNVCGNGFSTKFLNLKPKKGKVNIIIAPNKAVVLSKEKWYNEQPFPKKTS